MTFGNILNYAIQASTGKFDVFINYYAHTDSIHVSIYINGWNLVALEDASETFYLKESTPEDILIFMEKALEESNTTDKR